MNRDEREHMPLSEAVGYDQAFEWPDARRLSEEGFATQVAPRFMNRYDRLDYDNAHDAAVKIWIELRRAG